MGYQGFEKLGVTTSGGELKAQQLVELAFVGLGPGEVESLPPCISEAKEAPNAYSLLLPATISIATSRMFLAISFFLTELKS